MVRPCSCYRRMPAGARVERSTAMSNPSIATIATSGSILARIRFPTSASFDVARQSWSRGQIGARLAPCHSACAAAQRPPLRFAAANTEAARTAGQAALRHQSFNENAGALMSIIARSPARSNQRPDDARPQSRKIAGNLLRRTAGPYIWVNGPPWRSTAVTLGSGPA
jgi:hypothetical protein